MSIIKKTTHNIFKKIYKPIDNQTSFSISSLKTKLDGVLFNQKTKTLNFIGGGNLSASTNGIDDTQVDVEVIISNSTSEFKYNELENTGYNKSGWININNPNLLLFYPELIVPNNNQNTGFNIVSSIDNSILQSLNIHSSNEFYTDKICSTYMFVYQNHIYTISSLTGTVNTGSGTWFGNHRGANIVIYKNTVEILPNMSYKEIYDILIQNGNWITISHNFSNGYRTDDYNYPYGGWGNFNGISVCSNNTELYVLRYGISIAVGDPFRMDLFKVSIPSTTCINDSSFLIFEAGSEPSGMNTSYYRRDGFILSNSLYFPELYSDNSVLNKTTGGISIDSNLLKFDKGLINNSTLQIPTTKIPNTSFTKNFILNFCIDYQTLL